MKMENRMHYKTYLYIFFVFLSIFALSSINYEKIIKQNKIIETKILVMILGLALGYLITNFVVDFIGLDKIF